MNEPLQPPPERAPRAPRITFHIDELVLHGSAPGDPHRIADALQTELHRLISEQGAPAWAAESAFVPSLTSVPKPALAAAGPQVFGTGIAQAVYQATAERRSAP